MAPKSAIAKVYRMVSKMENSMAHARKSDPFTSHLAAATIMDATTLQIRIIQCFDSVPGGLTDEQLVNLYNSMWGNSFPATESSIRSRRSELNHRGSIIDTGKTRNTKNGHKAIVWEIEGRLF